MNNSEDPFSDSENQGKKFFNKLLCSLDKPNTESRAKVHEPEVYDGNDQAKLRTFFLQCMLNFQDRPKAFAMVQPEFNMPSLTSRAQHFNTSNLRSSAK